MKKPFKIAVDLELLKKYSQPGPRYTSYPTAPHFHEGFGASDFYQEILNTNQGNHLPELSLYFHFPFCRSLCYFCGCNVIITHNPRRIEEYLIYLKKEVDLISGLINPERQVVQMHWGGGTPTYLTPQQITDIFHYIQEHFQFAPGAEISIEFDPRRLLPQHLPTIRRLGFNRVSFGIQDFNPQVQEAVNRIQPDEVNRQIMNTCRELNFDSVNIDLIYGLPHQTIESYEETLQKVIELSPDRLAVFNYAHVPWLKKHQRVIPEEALPSPDQKLVILKLAIERLTEAGYVYIGMDHFAKPEDELAQALTDHTLHRNFQGYSTHGGAELYGMGLTSISALNRVYAQNAKHTRDYCAMLDQGQIPTIVGCKLDADDVLRRYVIMEIMCNNRVIKSEVERRFGVNFDTYFADSLAKLSSFIEDDLVTLHPDRLQVSEEGRLVIRNIAMAFDRYLEQDQKKLQPIYSKTV